MLLTRLEQLLSLPQLTCQRDSSLAPGRERKTIDEPLTRQQSELRAGYSSHDGQGFASFAASFAFATQARASPPGPPAPAARVGLGLGLGSELGLGLEGPNPNPNTPMPAARRSSKSCCSRWGRSPISPG